VTPEPNDPAVAVEELPLGAASGAAPPNGPVGPGGPGGQNGSTGPSGARHAGQRSNSRWIREGVIVVVIAVLVAVLLRAFVVQTFFIPSGSMEPTLQVGDRILVNKLSYDLHGVDRGDIVVFSRPPAENCGGPEVNDLVKRVIGLPGETISLAKGYVYIDGKRLNESWLPSQEQGVTTPGPGGTDYSLANPFHIPANDYFVMGDNRTDSCDSRYWGPIPGSLIVGKVDLRVWPLSSIRIF
jgi:signal peptidase I